MDKQLALAINFKSAPKELQEAALAHYEMLKNIEKLKASISSKQTDLAEVEMASGETAKKFRVLLNKWEPEVK